MVEEKPAADERQVSADSGRGSAEPQAGMSSGRSDTGGLDPPTVRSILAAQNDENTDDEVAIVDKVDFKAEVKEHDDHEILCRCNCSKTFVVKVKVKKDKNQNKKGTKKK